MPDAVKKTRVQREREKVKLALDHFDKEFESSSSTHLKTDEGSDFAQILEEKLQTKKLKPGEVIKGKIVKIFRRLRGGGHLL